MSEVRGQRSEVRSQTSEVRSQMSEADVLRRLAYWNRGRPARTERSEQPDRWKLPTVFEDGYVRGDCQEVCN